MSNEIIIQNNTYQFNGQIVNIKACTRVGDVLKNVLILFLLKVVKSIKNSFQKTKEKMMGLKHFFKMES